MRFIATSLPRRMMVSLCVAGALLGSASTVSAQGLGIGARLSWVTSDTEADVDAVRFTGGQLRLLGQRLGLEVAIDRRSESFDLRNEKVTETPIQASLLLRLASGSVSPYLLGGPGWYRRKVEPLDGADNLSLNSTEFGWHAGGGLEFIAGRHFGIHGDYRYTFLDFSDDEEEDEGFVGRLLPGHKGSMWTVGATFYF
jgi:opacity protein-like surface antigen